MPTIYDNIQTKLLDELQKRLAEATRADFSVGYFNLRGWRGLADGVDKLPPDPEGSCWLLIGMNEGPESSVRRQYRLTAAHELMDNLKANSRMRIFRTNKGQIQYQESYPEAQQGCT